MGNSHKLCQRCKSNKIILFSAKCGDLLFGSYKGIPLDDIAPGDIGMGDSEYIEGALCTNCGQLQGKFPLKNVI